MALNVFNPDPGPSPGTARKAKPKLLAADFGEGYTQTAADGVNFIKRQMTLRWDGITLAQKYAIIAFFENQAGYQPFYYWMYGDTAPFRWTCEEWEENLDGAWKITATFKQYYGVLT